MKQSLREALIGIQDWPSGYHEQWKPKTMEQLGDMGLVEKRQVKGNFGIEHGAWFLTPAGFEAIVQIKTEY